MTARTTTALTRGGRSKGIVPRIQRPCMSQAIKTAPSMTVTDCNNCLPKGPTPSWDVILSARSKTKSGFSSSLDDFPTEHLNTSMFDPHRVLRFFFSELKTRLQFTLPDDKNVHKILSEIQLTMKRLGPTANKVPHTASSCNLVQGENQKSRAKRHNFSQTDERILSLFLHEKASQTEKSDDGLDRPTMEEQIKQSHEKLKENCDALEKACAALHDEKSSIHAELCRCRDEIALLKTEVSSLQTELKEAATREKCTTQDLESQCRLLQDELKRLQDFMSKQKAELAVVESLNGKLKESSEKISLLERSRLENNKILVFTQLEKEKLMALYKFRENHMEALQKHVTAVFKLLKKELSKIHYDIETSGYGDDNHKIGGRFSSSKKLSRRKYKIDLSSAPATKTASNFESNVPPKSSQNETRSRKMHQRQSGQFSNAVDVACDLFSKETITLKDHYLECDGGGDRAESSVPSPARSESHKGESEGEKKQQLQETAADSHPTKTPVLNMDAKNKRQRGNRVSSLDYFYSGQGGSDKKSRVDLHHPERRQSSASKEFSDFEELKGLFDDVTPPAPPPLPRPFSSLSTSISTDDGSFDHSQENCLDV